MSSSTRIADMYGLLLSYWDASLPFFSSIKTCESMLSKRKPLFLLITAPEHISSKTLLAKSSGDVHRH